MGGLVTVLIEGATTDWPAVQLMLRQIEAAGAMPVRVELAAVPEGVVDWSGDRCTAVVVTSLDGLNRIQTSDGAWREA